MIELDIYKQPKDMTWMERLEYESRYYYSPKEMRWKTHSCNMDSKPVNTDILIEKIIDHYSNKER